LSLLFRETPVYKASSEKIGSCNGEEKISLIASSLRMAADPEYLPWEGKGKSFESMDESRFS
jgi:hypothetical protein